MPTKTRVRAGGKRCKPFLIRVMVFSPESGYKFTIEIQKACTASNDEVWKLLFDLFKRIEGEFEEVVSVEFVAGDPNDIEKIAAITDEGMKRSQVRAFRDNVFPLVRPFADEGREPTKEEQKKIDQTMKKALNTA
jgi:hypothetical protein